jgi:hypothetical protein
MLRSVACQKFTDVSEIITVSIINNHRNESSKHPETSVSFYQTTQANPGKQLSSKPPWELDMSPTVVKSLPPFGKKPVLI